ncbi:hypothetical protein AgCh_016589 [Apium graveolens]
MTMDVSPQTFMYPFVIKLIAGGRLQNITLSDQHIRTIRYLQLTFLESQLRSKRAKLTAPGVKRSEADVKAAEVLYAYRLNDKMIRDTEKDMRAITREYHETQALTDVKLSTYKDDKVALIPIIKILDEVMEEESINDTRRVRGHPKKITVFVMSRKSSLLFDLVPKCSKVKYLEIMLHELNNPPPVNALEIEARDFVQARLNEMKESPPKKKVSKRKSVQPQEEEGSRKQKKTKIKKT